MDVVCTAGPAAAVVSPVALPRTAIDDSDRHDGMMRPVWQIRPTRGAHDPSEIRGDLTPSATPAWQDRPLNSAITSTHCRTSGRNVSEQTEPGRVPPAPWECRASLRNLVLTGTIAVAVAGTLLFYNFAWLQTGQPWSLIGWLPRCIEYE
jgi:hypothetical protein